MNQDTRSTILAAATRRFAAQGYHATSVSQIIRDAGMAQGSFYNYFDNKRALYGEILADLSARLCARVEAVAFTGVRDKETYAQVGMQLASTLTAFFFEHQDDAKIFFWGVQGVDRDASEAQQQTYDRIAAYSAAYLEHGQRLGIVRPDLVPSVVAQGLVGMSAYLTQLFLRGALPDVPIATVAETILNVHLYGIFA